MKEEPSAKQETQELPVETTPGLKIVDGISNKETGTISLQLLTRLKQQATESIEMKADIKTVISVLGEVMNSFGLQDIEISGGANNIQSLLPAIVGKLSREMMMGTFNTQGIANVQAIMPIIEKYKRLSDES